MKRNASNMVFFSKKINYTLIYASFFMQFYLISTPSSAAEAWFNPRLLSEDANAVADLSNFEKGQELPSGFYQVDIYLNDIYQHTTEIEFSFDNTKKKMVPCLTPDFVSTLPIKYADSYNVMTKACPTIQDIIPSSMALLNVGQQRLDITIPQAYLVRNPRGYISPTLWNDGITAGIVNYAYSGGNYNYQGDWSTRHFLNLRSGINLGAWRLRDYSTWSYNKTKHSTTSDYNHLQTTLGRDLVGLKSRLLIGDNYTNSSLYDSTSFRGLQLTSEDTMLPDSERNFAPTVRGIAKSTAVVTISQNGYEIYQETVPAGPFAINDLNSVSTGGELYVTIKEADGSVQSFSLPWTQVPNMQRKGNIKYAVSAGEVRGNNSDIKKSNFIQGDIYYGLYDDLTLTGGTQLSHRYNAFTLGLSKSLGELGAISFNVTQANSTLPDNSKHSGQKYNLIYQKNINQTNTDIQLAGYIYSTRSFYDFNTSNYKEVHYTPSKNHDDEIIDQDYRYYYDLNYRPKGKVSLNLSQQLFDGSLYISAEKHSYWNTNKTEDLLQAGYSSNYNRISYSINYSYNDFSLYRKTDQAISFNLSLPLNLFLSPDSTEIYKNSFISNSFTSNLNGSMNNRINLSGTALNEDALNYNLSQGYNKNKKHQIYDSSISGSYYSPWFTSGAGYSYSNDNSQLYYNISGGILMHSDGITFGQSLNQSAALIKAPGAKYIPISGERGLYTDSRGYAIVSNITNYRNNRIALDVNKLPDNVEIENSIVNVIPTNQAIVAANFSPIIGHKAFINIYYNHKYVPFGSTATVRGTKSTSFVGDNGELYISGLSEEGIIDVKWGSSADEECTVHYKLPDDADSKQSSSFTAICQ